MEDELSLSEKKLFDYIKTHSEEVPSMTADQLGNAVGISSPTVVRFAKKVGFKSLTEFKLNLSADVWQPVATAGYTDVLPNESVTSLKSKMCHNTQITIQETTDILDEQVLLKAVQLIENSETIILSGIGASQLIAEDIRQKWTRIGKNVLIENDYNALLPQYVMAGQEVVVWLLSNSGETPEIICFGECAKSLHLPILSLTRLGNNPLSKLADVSLQVSRPKESTYRSAATNSIFAHLLAVDILFYMYISRNKENAEKIINSRKAVEKFREKYF